MTSVIHLLDTLRAWLMEMASVIKWWLDDWDVLATVANWMIGS